MKEKKNKKKRVNEKEKKIEVVERLNIVNLELKQEKQVEKPRDRKQIFFTDVAGSSKKNNHPKKDKLGFLCSVKRFPSYENLNPGPSHYCIKESFKCFMKNKLADKILANTCRVLSPGPADYNVDIKTKCSFNTKSSVHFPVLYGREPDCSEQTPAPNAYNITKNLPRRCCYWRRGRSIFTSPLFQNCFKHSFKPAPNQYSLKDSLTKPKVDSQSSVSFKSNVPQFHSFPGSAKGSGLSPCHYHPKIDVCTMKKPKTNELIFLNLRKNPMIKPQDITTPGPGAYEVSKSGACLNISQQPNWFFQQKVENECEEMMEMWREINKKRPGPADYDVMLPTHKSFNYGYKNFISVV